MARLFSLVFLALLLAANAFSQGVFGSMQGTLTDDSGAVVPKVRIMARNVETGLTFTSESNEAGIFLLGELRPGRYDVTAERQGFSTFTQKGITLRVNDQIRIDIQMKVGQISERVEVAAEAPLVQSEKSIIGKVVEERAIKELPLAGRSAFSLFPEFAVQLIQTHDAHFCVFQRREMQQVLEFFLILPVGIRFG